MCQTKTWKRLEIRQGVSPFVALILGTRSDNLIVSALARFPRELSNIDAANITIKSLNELESYRNCLCTPEIPCEVHKEKTAIKEPVK